ncbi:DUF4873 domain-containing protein [Streptomyces calidiresistens]|uniref:DUF4873 domain-containing protein n=1 Tax=Streptomyces calidiresistens TaxID=1485586 RepID=A0A7W3T3E9_9ACTN|nr:DUF4873 domain-containing protein [Streptomyces calidiresistens]MBB0229886.1 DUF4873 domain-containing protein [Streptomyces calidiresistens]
MSTWYEGPATMVVDGEEIAVTVRVDHHTEGSGWKSWSGTARFEPGDEPFAHRAFEANEPLPLYAEDGSESRIGVTGVDRSRGEVTFEGAGLPPNFHAE